MMIGEPHRHQHHNHHAPPWPDTLLQVSIPTSPSSPPYTNTPPLSPSAEYAAAMASLRHYLLSSTEIDTSDPTDFPSPDDDEFFMYEFKVRKCTRARAHDWTECPFAHPGEKARRRDPRIYTYSGTACTDFRKGGCKKGDSCEFAHGVFECWLHPTRYRTQACKDGAGCRRRVCFFAHHPDQLRPGSTSPRAGSEDSWGSGSMGELVASLRNLQLNKVKSMPSSWVGVGSPVFGSPRGTGSPSVTRAGFFSLPATPTQAGLGYLDLYDNNTSNNNINNRLIREDVEEHEPVLERVESGRALRARMFERLCKENPLNGSGLVEATGTGPDFGWVSDLIK